MPSTTLAAITASVLTKVPSHGPVTFLQAETESVSAALQFCQLNLILSTSYTSWRHKIIVYPSCSMYDSPGDAVHARLFLTLSLSRFLCCLSCKLWALDWERQVSASWYELDWRIENGWIVMWKRMWRESKWLYVVPTTPYSVVIKVSVDSGENRWWEIEFR
jgi:hypothetical protein